MSLRIIFAYLVFMIIPISGFSDEITLERFLVLVKENHPLFRKEALQVDIEKKQSEKYLGAKDWNLSITPSFSHLGEASAFEYGGADSIDNFSLDTGISRALWSTGGRLGFSLISEYTYIGLPTSPHRGFKQGIAVRYTQPLLQNSQGKLDRLNYELSKYTVDSTKVQSLENQEDFMLDIATRFVDWAHLSELVNIAEEYLNVSAEQLKQVKKKHNANLVGKVDVLRAEDAVRIAEQSLLLLESQWRAKQAELASFAQYQEIYKKTPSYDLYRLEDMPEVEESISNLKQHSRLLKILTTWKKQLVHLHEGFVDKSRPELNLNLTGGLYGRDESFLRSWEITKPDAYVSLAFMFPLENRTAKADIEKVNLQIKQINEEIKNVEIYLEATLRSLLIQISEMEKILALNQAQIKSAKDKTDEELKLYNQGEGNLTFVIQSRENEVNAKITYADNTTFYQKLLVQYRALFDELFPEDS